MAKINFFYQKHVVEHLVIGLNDNGLFVSIPSENTDERYEVQCEESATRIEVKSCHCLGFKRHNNCKHTIIVQDWWDACYKPVVAPVVEVEPVVEETSIFEVERKSWYIVNHTHQVWVQDGKWICCEGAEFVEMVKAHLGIQDEPQEVVPPIAMELPAELKGYRKKAVSVDISNKGNFGSKPFSLLKVS